MRRSSDCSLRLQARSSPPSSSTLSCGPMTLASSLLLFHPPLLARSDRHLAREQSPRAACLLRKGREMAATGRHLSASSHLTLTKAPPPPPAFRRLLSPHLSLSLLFSPFLLWFLHLCSNHSASGRLFLLLLPFFFLHVASSPISMFLRRKQRGVLERASQIGLIECYNLMNEWRIRSNRDDTVDRNNYNEVLLRVTY